MSPTDLKTLQPAPLSMSISEAHHAEEKAHSHAQTHGHQCRNCQRGPATRTPFTRAAVLSGSLLALALLVLVAAPDAITAPFDVDLASLFGCMRGGSASVSASGLGKRQSTTDGSGSGSGGGQSVFVKNKYYLIVALVGLALVVLLGICLSAWCCRGSFENPLCCPCYLCACCGGLACLECIACGLCAEAIEQV